MCFFPALFCTLLWNHRVHVSFSSKFRHTHVPWPRVYTYLAVSSIFSLLCSSWSFLFLLLINCTESLCQMCAFLCLRVRVFPPPGCGYSEECSAAAIQRQSKGHTQHRVMNWVPQNLISSLQNLMDGAHAGLGGGGESAARGRWGEGLRKQQRGEIWMRCHHFARLLLISSPNGREQREGSVSNGAITPVENEKIKWPKTPPPHPLPSFLPIFLPFSSLCSLMLGLPPDVRSGADVKSTVCEQER